MPDFKCLCKEHEPKHMEKRFNFSQASLASRLSEVVIGIRSSFCKLCNDCSSDVYLDTSNRDPRARAIEDGLIFSVPLSQFGNR